MLLKYKHHIFVGLLLITGTFSFSDQLVDKTHIPRFLGLFIVLFIIFLFSPKKIINYLNNNFNALDGLFILFSGLQLLSIIWATNKAEAFGESFKSVALFSVYLYFRSLLVDNPQWKNTLPLMFTLINIFYLVLTWMTIFDIQKTIGFNSQSAFLLSYPSGHKNLIAIFIFGLLAFPAVLLYDSSKWKKKLGWTTITLSIITLFMLTTRSVSVGLFAGGLFAMVCIFLKKIPLKKGGIIAVILIITGISLWTYSNKNKTVSLKNNFQTEITLKKKTTKKVEAHKYKSINERFVLWKQTLILVAQNPILGVGAGNWKIEFPKNGYNGLIRAEFHNTSFNRPHNDFLWILSEFGVFTFIIFCSIIFLSIKNGLQGSINDLIITGGLLVFLLVSCFDFPRERPEHTILLAALLAISGQPWRLKQINLFKFSKLVFFLIIIMLGSGGIVYTYRFFGEKNYYDMRRAKADGQHNQVIRKAAQAESYFYTIDGLNFPLKWYSAISYTYLGQFNKGEKEFREALIQNPYNFHTLNNLGFCLASQKKYKEAIPYLQQALFVNEHFEDARFNLAFSYMEIGKYADAIEVLQKNIKNTAKKEIYEEQLKILMSQVAK